MQIHGPAKTHQVHGPHGVNAPHSRSTAGATEGKSTQAADQLDISPAAQEAARLAEAAEVRAAGQADAPIRQDVVARVRAEIASGSYETPEKLDAALDSLLDQIG